MEFTLPGCIHITLKSVFSNLCCTTDNYIPLRCVALRCVALRCVALRCVALRCVALRCVALRCVALHCIALYDKKNELELLIIILYYVHNIKS